MRDDIDDQDLERLRAIVATLRRPEVAVPAQGRKDVGRPPRPSPLPGVPRRSLEMLLDLLRLPDGHHQVALLRDIDRFDGQHDHPADAFDRAWASYWSAHGLTPDQVDGTAAPTPGRDVRGCYVALVKPHFAEAWRRAQAACGRLPRGQRRVLELVRDGQTNRQVARELGISEATVRTHLQNAYAALGVTNRVAAVGAAFGADEAREA